MQENVSYTLLRQNERVLVGEDFTSGPGYAWLSRKLREEFSSQVSEILRVSPELLVLIPRNAMGPRGYLNGIVEPSQVIEFDRELDGVACASQQEAERLRHFAPIAFPASTIRNAAFRMTPEWGEEAKQLEGTINPRLQRRLTAPTVEEQDEQMQHFREVFSEILGVSSQELKLFMGAEEALKAILRVLTQEGTRPLNIKLFLPSYGNWIANAQYFGANVYQDMEGAPPCKVLYLSLPNNPLGYGTDPKTLAEYLASRDEEVMVIDITSLDLDAETEGRNPSTLSAYKKALWGLPKQIILVDSVSKKLMAAESRVGFLLCNDQDLAGELGEMEPPCLGSQSLSEVLPRLKSFNAARIIAQHSAAFGRELNTIISARPEELWAYPSSSNFTVVYFHYLEARDRFLNEIQGKDWPSLVIRSATGLPLVGAGQDTGEDALVPVQGKAILGLPSNCVRLCTLSHPSILETLRSSV